jgi:DDE superfamily endonuclease
MPKQKQSKPLDRPMLDLYADYLISSFSFTTATGMSAALDGAVSHDAVTRFLSGREYTNKDLWKLVKPVVREIETEDGVLILDDTIEEKQYTDENDIVAWHYDHVFGRSVKGVNILNCLYANERGTVPVGCAVVTKDLLFTDPQTEKLKRKSFVTKNEQARGLIGAAIQNQIKFRYCLADSWFASQGTMEFVVKRGKHFIFALKSNRTFAGSLTDKKSGRFQAVESLAWEEGRVLTGYLKGMDMPVELTRQVFTNEDGSTGILYLVTSDLTLGHVDIVTIYQKRWKVEEYHKSIKSNLGLAKSPTKTVTTQTNHFFVASYAYVKLERLARGVNLNQFALKTKLYVKALQASMTELERLRGGVAA